MIKSGQSLPVLTVNGQFMSDFVDADSPCFGLGLVEVEGKETGFLALRLDEIIPEHVLTRGFRLGHQLLGSDEFEVIYFGFEFYGFKTYNVLLNPSSELVKTVLETMVESKDYFFLSMSPTGMITTFRADIGKENLAGLKDNLDRILDSETTDEQYERFLAKFKKAPTVPGMLVNWVCQDDEDYLDLTDDRLDLNPGESESSSEPEFTGSRVEYLSALRKEKLGPLPEIQWHEIIRLPLIAQLIDGNAQDVKRQHDLLVEGQDRPYLFDEETIDRVIMAHLETLDFVEIYIEQLSRWQKEKLTKKQQTEIARLQEQSEYLKRITTAVLSLADSIADATIDQLIGMDEAELGLKGLLGEIPGA
ncbi:MAG: hypothetical protein C0473_02795 [Cyanobacteria bacterium DS3.002]|nr:hypothetical protein [Cyanobacteria bacterium DS3.002]